MGRVGLVAPSLLAPCLVALFSLSGFGLLACSRTAPPPPAATVTVGDAKAAPVTPAASPELEPLPAPVKAGTKETKPKAMDNERLDAALSELLPVKRQGNIWQMTIAGMPVTCVTDERHDRMRILTPVAKASAMSPQEKDRVLEANFHTALDARYAIFDGILYSVFIHPLSSLTDKQVESALEQVVTLAKTYGTAYTSSDLTFGGP